MGDTFFAAAAALIPVALVIATGWTARRLGLGDEAAWAGFNRVIYILLYPPLLFTLIAGADYAAFSTGPFLAAAASGFFAMAVVTLALKLCLTIDGPAYTSLFQTAVRWNGFVLLAAAGPLFGPAGTTLTAMIIAVSVPLVNVLSVIVLLIWGAHGGERATLGAFVRGVAFNPLIVACAAGGLAAVARWTPPAPVAATLDLLASATLPAILLSVGAGLRFAAVRSRPGLLALGAALKLMGMPVAMAFSARLFGLSGVEAAVLVTAGATPAAAAGYALAKEMGGDAPLVAALVTLTAPLSMAAMPAALALTPWLTGARP